MVQQINIPLANHPKMEVKEKSNAESTPFKDALKKAESFREATAPKDSSVKTSTESTEKPEALVEVETQPDVQQQNAILSALAPWVFAENMLAPQQLVQNQELLLPSAPIEAVADFAEIQAKATMQGGTAQVQTEATPQIPMQQVVLQTASSVENSTETMPVTNIPVQAQKTSLPLDGVPLQPVVQEVVAPQYAVQMPVKYSVPVEQKQTQVVSEVTAVSPQISVTNVETPVIPIMQNQQNFDTSLSGQSQQAVADSSKETSDSHGEFAALFANQNESVQSSSTVRSSAPAKLSTGTATHLTEQIIKNVQVKNNNFRMELFPHNLGKVSVSMKMEQGMLVVDILADNPRTQSILASGSGEIRSLLESAMGQPVQVTQPQQDAPAYYQQEQESSNQQQESRQDQQQSKQETTEDFLTVLEQMKEQSRAL